MDGFPGLFYLENTTAYEYHMRRNLGNFTKYLEDELWHDSDNINEMPVEATLPNTIFGKMYKDISKTISIVFGAFGMDWLPPPV